MITKKINGNEEIVAVDKFQLDHTANVIRTDVQALYSEVGTKSARIDLTSIIATGSTNTTGAQIPNGAYFYLNGVFCRAIADIATNATFTKNTNYIEATVAKYLTHVIEDTVSNLSISSAWGSLYTANTNIDISAYNFTSPPKILSVAFTSSGSSAWVYIGGVSTTNINVIFVRASTATVSGTLYLSFIE